MPKQYRLCGGIFTPRVGPALFTFVGVIVLFAMGFWQLERMAWKHALIAKISARMHGAPVALPPDFADPAAFDYMRVWVTGTFRHDKEIYQAARDVRYSVFGYHVLTPLETPEHQFVLVDRGYVPPEKKLPPTRAAAQATETVTVTGVARVPKGRGWLMPDNDPGHNFWLWVDLPQMAIFAGIPAFLPVTVDADATPNPGGYPLGGQTRVAFPDNHFVYAITWFCLAFALAAIFVIAHWKREENQ